MRWKLKNVEVLKNKKYHLYNRDMKMSYKLLKAQNVVNLMGRRRWFKLGLNIEKKIAKTSNKDKYEWSTFYL